MGKTALINASISLVSLERDMEIGIFFGFASFISYIQNQV